MRAPVAALAALAILATASRAPAAENPDWLSYGHDAQITNAVPSKAVTTATVRRLDTAWVTRLDGAVYASPLATSVSGRELLFAATENGSVYALAAADGSVVWQRSLGTVDTPACGTWGITSTGAIDPERRLLYVISADGMLHALALATGEEAAGYPLRIVANTGYEYVWGGLRIVGDRLYVPVSSYCDDGPPDLRYPEGRLVAVSLTQPAEQAVWDPVPGPANLGGIWGWGGVSVDPVTGDLFTGVGNSHVYSAACSCYVDDAGYGDQMVSLAPDLGTVLQADSLHLSTTEDFDFGAAPILFQPTGCPPLAAANNKDGTLYVWDRTRLAAGPIASVPLGDGIAAFVGTPSWSASAQTLYDAESVFFGAGRRLGNGVQALRVRAGCTFAKGWAAALGDGNQAVPLVAGSVVFATGGDPGGFFALSASSGARLWSAPTAGATVAAMISVDGEVFGADAAGLVYGFRPPPPVRKVRPVPLPPSPWTRVG